LVNQIDFSIKGGVAHRSSQHAFLDKMDLADCKQPLQLSELLYCNVLMKTECGAKTVLCLKDSGAQISLKKILSPACLRHVLSTKGTGWFGPKKLTEVIDTYENSQMYLPGKYSKFSDTGSAKPGNKFVKQTPSQYVGNSQNSAAYPRWKTGRSSQASGTPSLCWLCNKVGHRAVHCKKRMATQVS